MRINVKMIKSYPVLFVEGNGEADAFELGQLENQLRIAEVSHSHSYCDPVQVKIPLELKVEKTGN